MSEKLAFNEAFMPVGIVSLLTAVYLASTLNITSSITVRIGRGDLRLGKNGCANISLLLKERGLELIEPTGDNAWCGLYLLGTREIIIQPHLKIANIVTRAGEKNVLVQSKGGKMTINGGTNPEYAALLGAIGQTGLYESAPSADILYIAVPENENYLRMIYSYINRPLLQQLNLTFIIIDRYGSAREIPRK